MKSWQRIIRFVGFVAAISVWSTVVSAEPEFKVTAADGGSGDEFGRAVSIDGDFAVVGAWHIGTDIQNGAAYIYKRASGNTWTEIQKLTAPDGGRFGASVFMDGDNVIIGAYNADTGNGTDSGAAYVYVRDTVTDNFILQQTLVPADGTPGDFFGWSVAVDGAYAVIGAQNDDENGQVSGSAYIYKFNGTQWVKQIKLTPDDVGEFDYYGSSVSISGPYAIVGAIQHTGPFVNGPGAVYVYKRVGDTWSPHATLTAPEIGQGYFGTSVDIDDPYAIVGASHDDENGPYSGSAYIYVRDGETWSMQTKVYGKQDVEVYDYFGESVAISGDFAAVGAIGLKPGSLGNGYVHIFGRDGTNWNFAQELSGDAGFGQDYFGKSIAMEGDDLIVGGQHTTVDGYWRAGAAYIFTRSGGSESLSLQQKLMVSDADTSDVFGWAVSINGDLAVVGAPGRDDNGTDSGSSYVYVRTGTTWNQEFMITASDASENDNFGLAVATDGVNIIVGSVNQGFISGNAESSLAAGAVPTIGFRFGVNTKVQTTGTSGSAYVYRIPAGPTPGTDPAPVTISFRSVFGAPGDTILIPIHLSNSNTGRPVAGLQFASTLSHPEWVTYVGLADTSLLGDFGFASSLINDTLRVVAYSPTAGSISPGTDIHVVTIVGVIDGPTPLGSTNQIFAFETELADSNGVAFPDTLIIGAIQAGIRGDVSLDGRVAIGDVVKNVRLIIGLDQMPEPGSTLHNIADVNIDKQVDVADVIRQVNMILGIVTRPVPVASEPVTVSLGDVRIGPDGRQLVPVVLGGGSAMSGVQITFAYDPSLMTIGELVTTEAGVGWVWQHHARDGVYTLVGYGLQPAAGLTADSAPTFYLPVSITGRDAGRSLLTLTDVKLVDRTAHYLDVNLEGITVTVNREVALPAAFSLSEAAPNPFNPSTSIAYEVPEQTRITLTIYNLLGQE
ncbi:MAG: FG-GAP repeat protein, partial [Candidatus Latescibacteria bacterium]|nr:FG-GAP repeat protein [Candidatus Latescibacterota bacterium]